MGRGTPPRPGSGLERAPWPGSRPAARSCRRGSTPRGVLSTTRQRVACRYPLCRGAPPRDRSPGASAGEITSGEEWFWVDAGEASAIGARGRMIRRRRGLSLEVVAGLAGSASSTVRMPLDVAALGSQERSSALRFDPTAVCLTCDRCAVPVCDSLAPTSPDTRPVLLCGDRTSRFDEARRSSEHLLRPWPPQTTASRRVCGCATSNTRG